MVTSRLKNLVGHADVAQLVAHHLAKVRVTVRIPSSARGVNELHNPSGGVAERRGNGLQSRVHGFKSRLHLERTTIEQFAGDWRRG